nr:protein SIEVE ELEMENT OCCLUSION B-like [Ipomoea batatas]
MVVLAAVGRYPTTVACVECWRTMEKFFMYIHARHLRHHPRPRLPPTTPILGSASSSVTAWRERRRSCVCEAEEGERYFGDVENETSANGFQLYCFTINGVWAAREEDEILPMPSNLTDF